MPIDSSALPAAGSAPASARSRKRACRVRGAFGAIVGAAIASCLSACLSLAPGHERPALPVAARYDGAGDAAAATSAATIAWRDFSSAAELNTLVEQALAYNRDLRAAMLRVEEARAAYGIQRADRLPTIGAAFDAARSRVPGDLSITGQPVVGNQFQAGFGLSTWELDFWGRVRNLSEAALQNYLASDSAQRAVRSSLIAQVANSYLNLADLDERLELARRTVASRAESLRIFRRRVELGATSRFDLTQVELLWRQATALVTQLEQAREFEAHALALLVGSPDVALPARVRLDGVPPFRELDAGLPSELLLQRPDIVAAEQGLRAAEANIGAARAAFFPSITLTGFGGSASVQLDGLFDHGSASWTFAPSLSLPIFDGGRRRASLDLAEVRRDQAVVQYERTVQSAFRDVSDALSARRWLDRRVEILRATLDLQAERARLAKLSYDAGAVRYLEVLDAERELLAAQQQVVQTERERLSAQVSLYAALGGGALEPAPRPAASSGDRNPSPPT